MKNQFAEMIKLLSILVLIVGVLSFTTAQGNPIQTFTGNDIGNIGTIVGGGFNDSDITVKGADVQKQQVEGRSLTFVTFKQDDSYLKIKDREFNNMAPAKEGRNSWIKLDDKGQVVSADFSTNDKGGTYTFGNDKVYAPPNSKLNYMGNKLSVAAPENSELKELPKKAENEDKNLTSNLIEFSGKNLEFPDGNILNDGKVYWKDGNFFLDTKDSPATINNVLIQTNDKASLFFDGKAHDLDADYISLNAKDKSIFLT